MGYLCDMFAFPIGIIASGVEESSKAVRKFALITLRTLGFGKRCMQDSILQEAENVITEFGQRRANLSTQGTLLH